MEISDNTNSRNLEEAEVPVEYPEGEIPLTGKQPGSSADVAELILFLASDRAKHITGTPVWIDGAEIPPGRLRPARRHRRGSGGARLAAFETGSGRHG